VRRNVIYNVYAFNAARIVEAEAKQAERSAVAADSAASETKQAQPAAEGMAKEEAAAAAAASNGRG